MPASILPSDCLEIIFLNLIERPYNDTSTKDLHSCTLVSRHWCRISTPLLYAYPFHHLCHLSYPDKSYFKLIRTLLSCIPKTEIEQIILTNSSIIQKFLYYFFCSDKYNKSPNILATFNYISFIRGLVFEEKLFDSSGLIHYQRIWLPSYIPKYMWNPFFSKKSILIINHLLIFLCKNCNNLTSLKFPFTIQNEELLNNIIASLTFKSRGLKELYYINTNKSNSLLRKDLYSSLSNNVFNLNLLYSEQDNLVNKSNSLSQFVSLQKKLQHVILSRNGVVFDDYISNERHYYDVVFNSLSTQSEHLQKLKFIKFNFNNSTLSDEAINSLCLLKNIRELRLYKCGCTCSNLNLWAKNLKNLEVFEFIHCLTTSDDFLVQIIQSSSYRLTKLVLIYKRDIGSKLLKEIPLYLHSLVHLELAKIYPVELVSILKSCTQLIYLSISLKLNDLERDLFKNLGKFIPNTLKKIQFKEARCLKLTSELLKSFLEECINGGGTLKYLEFNGDDNIGNEYFDVSKQFGVQLTRIN